MCVSGKGDKIQVSCALQQVANTFTDSVAAMRKELAQPKVENANLKQRVRKLEDQSRRDNLVFHGITEKEGANESWDDCEISVKRVYLENDRTFACGRYD